MFRNVFCTLHHLLFQLCFLSTSWTFKKPSNGNSLKCNSQLPVNLAEPSRFVFFGMWFICTEICFEEDTVILFLNFWEASLNGTNWIGDTMKDPWILNREAIPPSHGS